MIRFHAIPVLLTAANCIVNKQGGNINFNSDFIFVGNYDFEHLVNGLVQHYEKREE